MTRFDEKRMLEITNDFRKDFNFFTEKWMMNLAMLEMSEAMLLIQAVPVMEWLVGIMLAYEFIIDRKRAVSAPFIAKLCQELDRGWENKEKILAEARAANRK